MKAKSTSTHVVRKARYSPAYYTIHVHSQICYKREGLGTIFCPVFCYIIYKIKHVFEISIAGLNLEESFISSWAYFICNIVEILIAGPTLEVIIKRGFGKSVKFASNFLLHL